jgi:hypothetical protein
MMGRLMLGFRKSQCQWDEEGKEMTMPEWLAKEKELI